MASVDDIGAITRVSLRDIEQVQAGVRALAHKLSGALAGMIMVAEDSASPLPANGNASLVAADNVLSDAVAYMEDAATTYQNYLSSIGLSAL